MNIVNGYEGYIFSLATLLVILLQLVRNSERHLYQNRLFIRILVTVMILIGAETFSWVFDGMDGVAGYLLVVFCNTLLFLLAPFPLFFWILYLFYQIYEETDVPKRVAKILTPFLAVASALSLSTPFTGLFFTVDVQNRYQRGPLIGAVLILCLGLLLFGILLVAFTSKITSLKKKLPLIFFSIPPLIGIALQMSFYGLRVMWGSIVISILIAYIYMQNRTIGTDYLTGLHNRRRLDTYLRERIRNQQPGEILGALFIDIDKFKIINDNFGHKVGDRAINATARLLKKISRSRDFIARYGGDEFVILMDLKNESDLQRIVSRIREQCRIFNKTSNELFELKLSIGSDIYKKGVDLSAQAFLSHLDALMYADKNEGAKKII